MTPLRGIIAPEGGGYMDTIMVAVTQEYIDRGKVGITTDCPIALAITDMGYQEVIVDGLEVTWNAEGMEYGHILPDAAQDFIAAFDEEEVTAPFQFEVELDPSEPQPFSMPAEQMIWWDLELALLSPAPVGVAVQQGPGHQV